MEKLAKTAGKDPVTKADFLMSSVMTHPNKKVGDKCTTAISVSCGANSGKFPVTGKSVAAVGEFLREVLNVDRLAEGLVNGKKVEGNYILQPGDTLEYLKPAGQKG
jgi:phage terminase large subunit-like protein